MVIIAYLVFAYLSPSTGLFNSIIEFFGGQPIDWYREKAYWPFILVFVQQWKSIGFGMVLYLSSIVGISKDYYEAAQIDGATKWQQITRITLPLFKTHDYYTVDFKLRKFFRKFRFGLFYQVPMNQGSLYEVTDTIDTFVYRGVMVKPNMAMSSAAGFYRPS